jgi:hypothetical protein
MRRISDVEARELLEDAASDIRRKEFANLRLHIQPLSPREYLEFLNWAAFFMRESSEDRPRPGENGMLL